MCVEGRPVFPGLEPVWLEEAAPAAWAAGGFEIEPSLFEPPDFVALGAPLTAPAPSAGGCCLVPAPGAWVRWLLPAGCGEVGSAWCDGGGEQLEEAARRGRLLCGGGVGLRLLG